MVDENQEVETAASTAPAEASKPAPKRKAAKKSAKKAAKKAAPKKAAGERKPRAGRNYAPSAKLTEKAIEDMGKQATLVAKALVSKGVATTAEIAKAIAGRLDTKQEPTRVAGFYLAQFKADGLVKVAPNPKA